MYEYLKGTLADAFPSHAIVDHLGLGYKLLLPLSHYMRLPPVKSEVLFYLSLVIREDAHTCYGFLTKLDRDLFERLTEVSGIGPKTALSLIGHMETDALQMAIAHANIALLSKVPGIGKKTAERLVIEMRDKIKNLQEKGAPPSLLGEQKGGAICDAINALIHLGYPSLQAQKAVNSALKTLGDKPDLSQLITASLRSL